MGAARQKQESTAARIFTQLPLQSVSQRAKADSAVSRYARMWCAMPRHKALRLFLAHISRQDLRTGSRQIDHHETIQRIAELRIDAESRQFPAQLDVLAHQNRNAFAIRFQIRSRPASR
jgi:hypothetical protein